MADARNTGPAADQPAAGGVDVADAGARLGAVSLEWIREKAGRLMPALRASGEVRVRVVGDEGIAAAHARYAKEEGTTDVLTFDLRDDPGAGGPLDADLLVCFDEAARQAGKRGHSPAHELLLYIVHGMLHCLGHDDDDPAAAARMHEEEDRVLRELGVGAVFGGRSDGVTRHGGQAP